MPSRLIGRWTWGRKFQVMFGRRFCGGYTNHLSVLKTVLFSARSCTEPIIARLDLQKCLTQFQHPVIVNRPQQITCTCSGTVPLSKFWYDIFYLKVVRLSIASNAIAALFGTLPSLLSFSSVTLFVFF